MSDTFRIDGSYSVTPASGSPSADPSLEALLSETLALSAKHIDTITLSADAPVSVAFGGVTNAHAIIIKAVGGKVKVRLTSADGSTQAVPVDSLLILTCASVPVTAVDLTRVTGTSTVVKVFLGEKA